MEIHRPDFFREAAKQADSPGATSSVRVCSQPCSATTVSVGCRVSFAVKVRGSISSVNPNPLH